MTSDQNEYRKRQQQRALARKKREAARRRMRLRILLAAAALAVTGLLIYLAVSHQKPAAEPDIPQTSAQTQPSESKPGPIMEPQGPKTVIHIAAAGDLVVNDDTVKAGRQPDGSYDYKKVFMNVAPLLSNADVAVLNMEGNLCGQPYGTETASAPQAMMDALSDIGVDLVQAANSASIQNGLLGLSATLDGIRASGVEPVGAYSSNEEARRSKGFTMCSIQGIKVAFVAFTKGMNNLGLPAGSENCVNVLYEDYASTYQKVAVEKINAILQETQRAKPDLTVALLHWGSEFNDERSATQDQIRDLMLAGGVDVILGTHPHMVQEVEFDRENGTLVAYSLGDFFGDSQKAGTNYSMVLNLEVTRDNETGETRVTGFHYTPIYNLKPEESGEAELKLVTMQRVLQEFDNEAMNRVTKEAYDSISYCLTRVESRVSGNG